MSDFDPLSGRLRAHVAGRLLGAGHGNWWSIADGGPILPAPRGGCTRYDRMDVCEDIHVHTQLVCDRLPGHTGRHAAYGPRTVLGVWS